ncbi:hypothetical protein [Micromonospora sp. NPDC049282]|uniref:hypothetical protein n=1 Tax=Micromonospora sp. NPDC049282 TaxID=3364269 RepID=UPI003713391C
MLLTCAVTTAAFLVWSSVARLRRLTALVTVALVLIAATGLALTAVQPRAAVEARVLVLLGAAGTLLVARAAQRRRLGDHDREPGYRQWTYRIGVGLALAAGCGCFPLAAWDAGDDGFVPSVHDLVPPPDGLAVRGGGDTECAPSRCAVSYRLVGGASEPADRVAGRMWEHLARRGWPPVEHGWSCRPVGWLLDTRQTCITISTDDGTARITLEGGRPYPR